MKLTMVTDWNGNRCEVSSRLPDDALRLQSCVSQTQEYYFNLYRGVPTPVEILKHMVKFSIDEVE